MNTLVKWICSICFHPNSTHAHRHLRFMILSYLVEICSIGVEDCFASDNHSRFFTWRNFLYICHQSFTSAVKVVRFILFAFSAADLPQRNCVTSLVLENSIRLE